MARPNPADYGIPVDWTPIPGEFARHPDVITFEDHERLAFYHMDVMNQRNQDLLQRLDA